MERINSTNSPWSRPTDGGLSIGLFFGGFVEVSVFVGDGVDVVGVVASMVAVAG